MKIHLAAWGLGLSGLLWVGGGVSAQRSDVPRYKLDASWPKDLPNNWILGNIHGIAVDKRDHVWVLSSPRVILPAELGATLKPPRSTCCFPAPAVIELDPAGTVVKSWGGPGFVPDWPVAEQGLAIDAEDHVWIGGNWAAAFPFVPGQPIDQTLPWDRHVLKFSVDGKQLLEIGHPTNGPANNQDTSYLGGSGGIAVDDNAHEVYINDGYLNRRVVVYDSNTGAFKRGWGGSGMPLSEIDNARPAPYDPAAPLPKQFRGAMVGIAISADGFVYVCDRSANRIQVFTKDGTFVKEFRVRPETRGTGAPWGVAFSHDPKQKYLLVADGENQAVLMLDRNDGSIVGSFGHRGHNAGQFDLISGLAMDSRGNLYTGEVAPNNRVQKFVLTK